MSQPKEYQNIINYVYQNRSKTDTALPFNILDYLVFSLIAYIPFEKFEKTTEDFKPKSLTDMLTDYLAWVNVDSLDTEFPKWMRNSLFLAMSLLNSKRYKKVKVVKFTYVFDETEKTQFGAFTFLLPDNRLAISYRGTDNSILGWKEDFDLAVSLKIKGQDLSSQFLEETIDEFPGKYFSLMGHSKGGNFAVFAAIHLKEEYFPLLENAYSFDGPGLSKEEFESRGHKRIEGKVVHVIPKDDAVGMLLHHETPTYIAEAGNKEDAGDLVNLHDAYTWHIQGTGFETASDCSNVSYFFTISLNEWIRHMTVDTRKKFIRIFFEIVEKTKIKKANEIYEHIPSYATKFLHATNNISGENKKAIRRNLAKLMSIFTKNVSIYINGPKKKEADEVPARLKSVL